MLEDELRSPMAPQHLPVLEDPASPHKAENFTWQMRVEQDDIILDIHLEGIFTQDQFFAALRQDSTNFGVCCELNGKGRFLANRPGVSHRFHQGEKSSEATFRIPISAVMEKKGDFRISLTRFCRYGNQGAMIADPPPGEGHPGWRLVIWTCDPGSMYQVKFSELNS
jgi:hypothetical protein